MEWGKLFPSEDVYNLFTLTKQQRILELISIQCSLSIHLYSLCFLSFLSNILVMGKYT